MGFLHRLRNSNSPLAVWLLIIPLLLSIYGGKATEVIAWLLLGIASEYLIQKKLRKHDAFKRFWKKRGVWRILVLLVPIIVNIVTTGRLISTHEWALTSTGFGMLSLYLWTRQ